MHFVLILALGYSVFLLYTNDPQQSFSITFGIIVLFSIIDLAVIKWGGIGPVHQGVLAQVFWIVDVPFSLASLFVFVHLRLTVWHPEVEAFYLGATAFQLFAQNALFAIVWGGFLRPFMGVVMAGPPPSDPAPAEAAAAPAEG
ncbi:MAG: hypothetical protein HY566_01315 [Candidatus Kerfeldbacteria bacterium]|nr:hypothetical protein [Candidatus Kerfeldbacteria bacterium]